VVLDLRARETQMMDSMGSDNSLDQAYPGLPAAATVEASILLAQRLIAADLERKRARAVQPAEESAQAKLAA
jgi:hypothetical protein